MTDYLHSFDLYADLSDGKLKGRFELATEKKANQINSLATYLDRKGEAWRLLLEEAERVQVWTWCERGADDDDER